MITPVFTALTVAREELAALDTKLTTLTREHEAAVRELDVADTALTQALAAGRLGEAGPDVLAAAYARHEHAATAVRSLGAARTVLHDRRPVAAAGVADAEDAWRAASAIALTPERDRLRRSLQTLAAELQATLVEFARIDAITSRIPVGTRTGNALLLAAGLPEGGLDISLGRDRHRLSEAEILARLERAQPMAAE